MKMITCVAWKANKVLDGSRLLVLIKNHRQLNCGAVVLYWPVIASETGDEIVRGTAAEIARQFLPHVPPIKSGLTLSSTSFLSRCNEVSLEEDSLSCTLICKTQTKCHLNSFCMHLKVKRCTSGSSALWDYFAILASHEVSRFWNVPQQNYEFLNWWSWSVIHCS